MNYQTLIDQKLISEEELDRALDYIRRSRPTLGELAKSKNLLKSKDILKILQKQTTSGEPFGQIAIKLDYLSLNQVTELICLQESLSAGILEALEASHVGECQLLLVSEFIKSGVIK